MKYEIYVKTYEVYLDRFTSLETDQQLIENLKNFFIVTYDALYLMHICKSCDRHIACGPSQLLLI